MNLVHGTLEQTLMNVESAVHATLEAETKAGLGAPATHARLLALLTESICEDPHAKEHVVTVADVSFTRAQHANCNSRMSTYSKSAVYGDDLLANLFQQYACRMWKPTLLSWFPCATVAFHTTPDTFSVRLQFTCDEIR